MPTARTAAPLTLLAAIVSQMTNFRRWAKQFGRGFSKRNFWQMRAFYLAWPLPGTTPARSPSSATTAKAGRIVQTLSAQFGGALAKEGTAQFPLPWSHYARLLAVRSAHARAFYEYEALRGGWTIRQPFDRSHVPDVPGRRGQNGLQAEPRPDHGMSATIRAKRPVRGGLKVRAYRFTDDAGVQPAPVPDADSGSGLHAYTPAAESLG